MRYTRKRLRSLLGILVLASMVSGQPLQVGASESKEVVMDEATDLLFIHHSCGGQLLAEPGEQVDGMRGSGERCIYTAHPNGGGLRAKLEAAGYQVNELSYESRLGEDTDIQHWRAKFADHMADLLRTGKQDTFLPDGRTNSIVAFKSCYPNNDYIGMGEGPGDPDSAVRTVANSKASYNALLPLFQERPDVLFVALTPPPRAEPRPVGFKAKLKSLFQSKPKDAQYARIFNDWLADADQGWLADYPLHNVVVFDYYDILTGEGQSDWSRFATRDGQDSHPSRAGNETAAEAFVPFLSEAVNQWEENR